MQMLLAQAADLPAGTPWTAIMAVVTTLAGAVSVLFGLLNARMTAQLAAAEKRASDAEAGRAADRAELAAERASRLAYVQQLLDEERAARRDLESMADDQQTIARSEERGAFVGPGGSRQSRPDTGPQRIRGGGGPVR